MLTSFGVTIALHWRRRTPHPLWEVTAIGSGPVSTPLLVQLIPEIRHRGCKGIMLNCVSLGRLASCWYAPSLRRGSLKCRPDMFVGCWGSRTPNVDCWENRTPRLVSGKIEP